MAPQHTACDEQKAENCENNQHGIRKETSVFTGVVPLYPEDKAEEERGEAADKVSHISHSPLAPEIGLPPRLCWTCRLASSGLTARLPTGRTWRSTRD